ncbi:hypothetical protein [Microscilla marina]|uniref:Uncharacterized protein n=1 Tax=Microscilla marina ATCC 23134 TaxID=313606 RepID=A1ZK79_MICM2|nr:hypothetical protein [Microscilla marina]EAY29105.1 hypothetical protein M23134_02296 [Microscilla marina ATCC 23134]
MVDQLAKEIAAHASINEEQGKIAAEIAIEFIKKRVADKVDQKVNEVLTLTSATIKAEVYEAVTGEPKETFMEKASEMTNDAKEKIGEFAGDAKEKIGEFADTARNFFSNRFGKKEEEKKDDDKKTDDKIAEKKD